MSVETEDKATGAAVLGREQGPPCRRCDSHAWRAMRRPKSRPRYALEVAIAAPDVFVFQGDSGGWPSRVAEWWTCLSCGCRVRR